MLLSPTDSPPPDACPPVQILFCRRRLRPIFSRGRRRCPFRTLSIDSSSPETDSNASFIFRFLDFRKVDFRCDFLASLCCSHSSWKPRGWISARSPVIKRKSSDVFEVKATFVSDSADESEVAPVSKSKVAETVVLGLLFGAWYLFNIYFNIYNKQVLEVFPNPITLTAIQLAVGTSIIFLTWALNLHKWPNISRAQLLYNLHIYQTLWVVTSLLPIVGGVGLASLTEVSFNCAMASNLANQSRNVLSKKVMVQKEEPLDNITLFSIITIMSFFMFTPVALLVEGVKFTPAYLQSAGLNLKLVYIRYFLASICFHAYQQVAYMILQRVSPVTHCVGNCVKRVVVIVSSIFFFRTPISLINSIGEITIMPLFFLFLSVKSKSNSNSFKVDNIMR
ncbi:hypothetical protein LXL04_007010 [Taraxacum kok-saghyz]